MSATIAHLAALQLVRAIALGATTTETALPHIVRVADAALGRAGDDLPVSTQPVPDGLLTPGHLRRQEMQ